MEKMSMSHEDYLEAIVMLGGTTQVSVRSVDIATKLGVSKASVNKAMTTLKEKGLITGTSRSPPKAMPMARRCWTVTTCCSRS